MKIKPLVLSLCDHTANMVRPWAEAGFPCLCIDILPNANKEDNIIHIQTDIKDYLPPRDRIGIVFSFPPCTHLSVSGARWFKSKGLSLLSDAIQIVERCKRISEWANCPWMLENPVSVLSTHWRKPNYTFNPYEYGGYENGKNDGYTKKTCLWTSTDFEMPPVKNINPVDGSKMHLLPPSENRASLRSITPQGFAQAVYESNVEGVLNAK